MIWANELFPTTVRAIGLGCCFSIGFVGGFLSPYVVEFSYIVKLHPMMTLSSIGLFGVVSAFFLPETKGQALKDEIIEIT